MSAVFLYAKHFKSPCHWFLSKTQRCVLNCAKHTSKSTDFKHSSMNHSHPWSIQQKTLCFSTFWSPSLWSDLLTRRMQVWEFYKMSCCFLVLPAKIQTTDKSCISLGTVLLVRQLPEFHPLHLTQFADLLISSTTFLAHICALGPTLSRSH